MSEDLTTLPERHQVASKAQEAELEAMKQSAVAGKLSDALGHDIAAAGLGLLREELDGLMECGMTEWSEIAEHLAWQTVAWAAGDNADYVRAIAVEAVWWRELVEPDWNGS